MAAKLIVSAPDPRGRAFLAADGVRDVEDIALTAPGSVEWRGRAPRRGTRFPDVPPERVIPR